MTNDRKMLGAATIVAAMLLAPPLQGTPLENVEPTARGDAYLGQEPPGMTPEVFSPEVLTGVESGACSGFLNDGTVFVFKRLSPDLDWKFEPVYVTELVDRARQHGSRRQLRRCGVPPQRHA